MARTKTWDQASRYAVPTVRHFNGWIPPAVNDVTSSTSLQQDPRADDRPSFLNLSLEIRHIIFDLAINPTRDHFSPYDIPFVAQAREPDSLPDPDPIRRTHFLSTRPSSPDALYGLLLLNRQIHHEVLSWYPLHRAIRCNGLHSLAQFLREAPSFAHNLRHLSVVVNGIAQALEFDAGGVYCNEGTERPELNHSVTLDLLKIWPESYVVSGALPLRVGGEYLQVKDEHQRPWATGIAAHLAFYRESYAAMRGRLMGLRGLTEFTVEFVESAEHGNRGFEGLMEEEAGRLFQALPVGPVEGGRYTVLVGDGESGTRRWVFERRGEELVDLEGPGVRRYAMRKFLKLGEEDEEE